MRMLLPDMTAGNAEKDSPGFGLKMAKFIESEWGSERMTARRKQMDLVNSHMEGTVDVSHLKALFAPSKDLSALRVNWKYSSEVPRMINAIVEGFSYDKYRTTVKGIDMHSQEKRSKFRREKLKAMYTRADAEEVSRLMGMDFTHKGFVPQSKDELNLYMELDYKPAHELAMELAIQKVFDFSDWRETFNHIAEDLAKHGIGVAKVECDPETAIKLQYVSPRNFIYSRDVEETRDYRGAYYFGQFQRMTIGDIERKAKGMLSADQLKELAGVAGVSYANFEFMTEEDKQHTIDAIHFCFKTNRYEVKKKKYNKHGGYKYIDKPDDWTPPENMKSEVVYIPYEVWYEGTYFPGTNIVINYQLMDNMLRDPRNRRKAIAPFIMYKLSSESIAQKIIDISDDIYITLIKLRQFVLKMKPKGYAIDIDALGSLELPDGSTLDPIKQVKIMRDDGDLLYSGSSLVDDQQNVRLPIHDMPDSSGRELAELINVYNGLMQRLYDVTGINAQAAGGAPPPRTSSTVYEQTVSTSQKVVNNIFNGILSIQKRSSEAILSRLHAASVMKETEDIVAAIMGEYTTDIIKELANVQHYQYMINVDVRATDRERAELIQSLGEALQTGAITLMDKIDIEEIDNLRLAKQVIKLRQKANMAAAEQRAEMEHKRALELQQAKEQIEMQRVQFMQEMEMQRAMFENELKVKLGSFELEGDLRKISLKGQWDVAVAQTRVGAQRDLEMQKEDRKDERLNQQSTHQSELIEQRQNHTPPKNFKKQEEVKLPTLPRSSDLSPNI